MSTNFKLNTSSDTILDTMLVTTTLCNESVFDRTNSKQMLISTDDCLYQTNFTNISEDWYDSYVPYPDLTQLSSVRVVFLLLYLTIMTLALFGNFVVCYTVVSNRKMQTVVNCYIVNLAACDFLVGAFVLPVKLLELIAPANWYALNDRLCTAMLYLQTVIVFASVLTLVATCLERYFAIVYPLKSRMHQSKSRTYRIIIAVWIIPCVAALPFLYPEVEASENTLASDYGTISRLTCFINFDPNFRRGYYTFLFVFFYLIPLVFIAWTCFCIARSLLKHTVLCRQGSLRRQEVNRRKIGKMILMVVMAYTISWTPYFLVSIITQYQEVNFMQKHDFFFTMLCINLFAFLNSSINPFIYATMSTRFRSGFQRIFRCVFCYPNVSTKDIDTESVPRRKMLPKPLACFNKYHRQMMLFACGEPSQLSTDSSTHNNSETAVQTALIGSFRANSKTQSSVRRKRLSLNHNNNNNFAHNATNSNLLPKHITRTNNRGLVLNLNGSTQSNSNSTNKHRLIRLRTGSESTLPSLRKFWEENFIDLSNDNVKQIDYTSRKLSGISAISLPNTPTNINANCVQTIESVTKLDVTDGNIGHNVQCVQNATHKYSVNNLYENPVEDTKV